MTAGHFGLAAAALAPLLGCGARSDLDGAGGAGGAATATVSSGPQGGSGDGGSGGGGAGGAFACDELVLAEPVLAYLDLARAPALAAGSGGEVLLYFLGDLEGSSDWLQSLRFRPFDSWPPAPPSDFALIDAPVESFVVGRRGEDSVAVIRRFTGAYLASPIAPTPEPPLVDVGDTPRFVAGNELAFMVGGSLQTPSYDVLSLGSYQPGSLPQTEDPQVCVTSRALSAGVAQGNGFLVAHAASNPPTNACDVAMPLVGSIVANGRYDVGSGPDLTRTDGELVVADDRLVHLAMAGTSFGAWEVYQYAGDNARTPPPIHAFALGPDAYAITPNAPHIPVGSRGLVSPQLAVTNLSDALVVLWVDNVDPSSPTLIVQLVRPDGALGPSAAIPTSAVWQTGKISLLASADANSVLVAWEGGLDLPQIGLARLDCVGGP